MDMKNTKDMIVDTLPRYKQPWTATLEKHYLMQAPGLDSRRLKDQVSS